MKAKRNKGRQKRRMELRRKRFADVEEEKPKKKPARKKKKLEKNEESD